MMKGKPEQDTPSLDLHPVLLEAWSNGFSLKADFSRARAAEVAAACCLGLITTWLPAGSQPLGRTWRITPKGLSPLWTTSKPKERKQGD
jgi:hypothetical protein